jgi:hypothetical protein
VLQDWASAQDRQGRGFRPLWPRVRSGSAASEGPLAGRRHDALLPNLSPTPDRECREGPGNHVTVFPEVGLNAALRVVEVGDFQVAFPKTPFENE